MNDTTEASFWDHLEEARWGILRSLAYLFVGSILVWVFRNWLFDVIRYPAEEGVRRAGITNFAFRIFDPAGGIVLMMQAALVGGMVLAAPFWLYEIVRFVAPGLKAAERRMMHLLLPAAVLLFAGGVGFCYLTTPAVFAFLFSFNQTLGAQPEVTLVSYLYFFLHLVVVYGLVFELPLVIMFLVYFGILSTRALLRAWRIAVVIILIVAAIATPTPDPVTMSIMAAPMIALYFLSIFLGRFVEKHRPVEEGAEHPEPWDDDPYGLAGGGGPGLAAPDLIDQAPRPPGAPDDHSDPVP